MVVVGIWTRLVHEWFGPKLMSYLLLASANFFAGRHECVSTCNRRFVELGHDLCPNHSRDVTQLCIRKETRSIHLYPHHMICCATHVFPPILHPMQLTLHTCVTQHITCTSCASWHVTPYYVCGPPPVTGYSRCLSKSTKLVWCVSEIDLVTTHDD